MDIVQQAQDEVLWWEAAIDCHGPSADFAWSLGNARTRLLHLCRRTKRPIGATISQETIDLIMERVAMPDVIPNLLQQLCGETLEWRPGARDAILATCPLCANAKRNFGVNLQTGAWFCWACTEGGSLKWLLLRLSGLGFRDLFERLAVFAGVELQPQTHKEEVVLL